MRKLSVLGFALAVAFAAVGCTEVANEEKPGSGATSAVASAPTNQGAESATTISNNQTAAASEDGSTQSNPEETTMSDTQMKPPTMTAEEQTGPVTLEKVGEGAIAERAPKDGDKVAILKTNYGRIVLMFFDDKAPNHAKRFREAVEKGIYDGVKFHRVIPGFMIQGGDPKSKGDDRSNVGSGGWGDPMKAEFNEIKHVPGILSAARTNDPDSATSQFFLMHGTKPFLDGQYTVYGKVLEGLKVIDTIVNLPRDSRDNPIPENPAIILKAELVTWPVK